MPSPPASDDAALLQAVIERDDRDALADDLAQETFILAWRNLRRFRFEARFSTWLYRIAFNAWQTEARRKRELVLDLDEDRAVPGDDGFGEMPDVASKVDLERAMATLSDGERAAIAACYYADLSHEEAAQALGIPLGTVKTHVLRGKARLRAHLRRKEPE